MTASVSDLSPYPGLRPFLREESHLFFGREECIATMVDRLEENRFLAVLGASGSGKSSLVKVGLIEALERGDMQEAGRSWGIVQFKPQGRPMYELAHALLGKSAGPQQIELMVAFLRRGPRSLLEWCESGQLKPGENLLVFVDQFEELFRYRTYAGREEAEAFVALMLRTKNTRRLPVYVTLTMRSEFLGACAMIEDLAEAMNDGQFLTPQMNRDQCRAAIVGPARFGDFDVEEALVNRLLNDLASYSASDEQLVRETNDGSAFSDVSSQSDRFARRADQLPLLQHALNGLYSWTRAQSTPGRTVLKLKDYDALGGLQGSLNRHADSILAEVEKKLGPERAQKISAKLFRGLVSGTSPADAQRRPVRFPDLVKLCDGDEAAVRTIVEAFRKTGRNFLTPDPSKDIDDNSIIDISHESFIRQWTRLSAWLETEVQDAQSWRRLADAAADEGKGSGGLLRGPNLQTLLYWRSQASPTKEWAGRYGATEDEYHGAISFLERSRRAQRTRRVLFACLALAAGALLAGGYAVYQESERKQQFAELEFRKKEQQADQERIRIRQEADADKLRQRAEAAAADREKSERLFRISSKLFITTNQQQGKVTGWEESGSFIASLVDATPDANLDQILKPLQGRMVAQYAFRLPQDELGGIELRTDTRNSYRLSLLDGKRVAVIDARTRTIQREFDLSASEPVDRGATHSVSPDGKQALIILTEAESGKNSMVFVAGRPDGRSRIVKLPYTIRPDTLVADWNARRVIWSQRRDDVPEIAILDFSKLDFEGSRTRQRPEIRCKPIFDIVEYTEDNSLAQPFDKYETCSATTDNSKLEERKLKGKFRVVSLVDKLAIIQIIIEDFPVSAQLVAVNTETGSARILVSSESDLLVSKNLADDAPLRALSAVVTQGPRGSCAGANERSPGKPAPDTESEACLSFVDNTSGTPLDSPRYPLPLFDETRAYESIRLRAGEANARLVLEFSQRPSRWSIEVPWPASILNAKVPQASQQRESASSKILQWAGAKNVFSDLVEQRWQYRPESPTIKFLLFSDDAALIKTVQLNAEGTGGAATTPPLTIPRISESIGVPKRNRSIVERLPWLLSETADRIVVGNGKKLFEFGLNDSNPGKPILTGDLEKNTQPLEGGCRRRPGDGQSFSIQTVDDWPGRNPAFLVLDSLGRVWRVASRADKPQIVQDANPGVPAEPVLRDSEPAGSGTDPKAADQETSSPRNIICVTGSNLTSPIFALAPGSGRLLLQRDQRMLLVVEAPDGGDATKPPEPISKTPFDDDIVAATFVGPDRIAVLFKGGALTIFSQTRGRWISRGIPDVGFVSSLSDKPSPSLLASGNRLLVFHLNKAIIFDLDEAQDLRVVAAGSLPGTAMKVLGFKDDQIDLLASGQVVRARLPAIPPREVLARVLSARYPPPARAEQIEMARLQTTAGDETATSLKLKRLLALEANNRCRKQLGAFFAQEPFSEKADEEQRSQLRKEIGQFCSSQLSDAAKIPLAQWRTDAASLALEETGVPWPRSASNILHAAEAGDKQALWIIAGWASQGVKDKFDSAMPANEAWGKVIRRAIGRGDINPELRGDDPDLLKLNAIPQNDTEKLQEVSVSLKNSDRPWIHDRIGDRMREGDVAIRRGAMFHYALAETLYAAAGLESYAEASAEKRASIARIMAPDDITEAQNLIANWTALTLPATPPAPPKDDATRLREDLKSLDRLASSLEQEEFRLVLSEISRRIAATSRRLDGTLADEGQRKSALLASSYGKPLSDKTAQDVLDRWSEEFSGDRSFLVTMLARLLSAVEKENSAGSGLYRTPDLKIHKKITDLIVQNLQSADPAGLAAIADNLSLNRRAFSYATVRGTDREQAIAAASALKSRDKLLTLLLERNANDENYLAHRGVGRFWMGTSVAYSLASSSKVVQEAGKTVQEMVGPQSKNIQEALTDLKKARELGDHNFETLRRLADSQHWFFPRSTLIDYDAEAKDAISNYKSLTKALGDKRWLTPVTMAGLLSEYAELLRNLSSQAGQLDDKLEDGWRIGDESIRTRSAGLIVDSLYYASLADHTVHDAANAAGNSWGKEPGTNRAYAYALSRLANRLMSVKSELRPANDCDRAASHSADPLRRAPPAAMRDLADAARYSAAKAACERAYREQDPNASFLLARVLISSNDQEEKKRAVPLFHEAASQKYAAAFNSIAVLLKQPEKKSKYFYSYTQRVLRDHFSATFKYLSAQAPPTEKKRDALRWLAEQAAAVGVAEAHEALADMTSNQEKRKMHLLIAARLSTDAAKPQLAERADQIVLSSQSDRDARKDASKFVPSPVEAFESGDEEDLIAALKTQS